MPKGQLESKLAHTKFILEKLATCDLYHHTFNRTRMRDGRLMMSTVFFVVSINCRLINITWQVSQVLELNRNNDGEIRCTKDGFELASDLEHELRRPVQTASIVVR